MEGEGRAPILEISLFDIRPGDASRETALAISWRFKTHFEASAPGAGGTLRCGFSK